MTASHYQDCIAEVFASSCRHDWLRRSDRPRILHYSSPTCTLTSGETCNIHGYQLLNKPPGCITCRFRFSFNGPIYPFPWFISEDNRASGHLTGISSGSVLLLFKALIHSGFLLTASSPIGLTEYINPALGLWLWPCTMPVPATSVPSVLPHIPTDIRLFHIVN